MASTKTRGATALAKTQEATEIVPYLAGEPADLNIAEILGSAGGEDSLSVLDLIQVKIAGAQGVQWQIMDEDEVAERVDELVGVVLDWHPIRRYYTTGFDPDNVTPPDCQTEDGVHGFGKLEPAQNAHGVCAKCPLGQWVKGKKPACGEKMRVYFLRQSSTDDDALPEIIPLSIELTGARASGLKTFWRKTVGLQYRKPFWQVETKLTLTVKKGKTSKFSISVVEPEVARVLGTDEIIRMKTHRETFHAWVEAQQEAARERFNAQDEDGGEDYEGEETIIGDDAEDMEI